MKLIYSKNFTKSLGKLQVEDRQRIRRALALFSERPFYPSLRNHCLKGKRKGVRSISAGFDLRILYREEGGHAVVFLLQAGTHDQVY